jgi:hypothetical protein
MLRLQAQYGSVAMDTAAPQARSRGVQATHDWKALALELARLVYFDGVPEPKTALIRHCQQWFAERGLDMEFNSLDAQRDACEAYITSQRSEGWVLVPDRYDDGGVSGGTDRVPSRGVRAMTLAG